MTTRSQPLQPAPEPSGTALLTLASGTRVRLLESGASSARVEFAGVSGWVSRGALAAAALRPHELSAPVTYRYLEPQADQRIHVVDVDLWHPGIRVRTSTPAERGLTPTEFALQTRALAALNANFYSHTNFRVAGMAVGEGERLEDDEGALPLLACTKENSCAIFDGTTTAQPHWWSVVSGFPVLVRNGVAITDEEAARCPDPGVCSYRHPRSAVGLDAARRHLFLVVVEGRHPGASGMTTAELGAFLRDTLHVHEALNLDGGGSSALPLHGEAVTARPTREPNERKVSNCLAIVRANANGASSR